jgi:hypothetical protein
MIDGGKKPKRKFRVKQDYRKGPMGCDFKLKISLISFACVLSSFGVTSLYGQTADVAGVVELVGKSGDVSPGAGTWGLGLSAGWPAASRHRIQGDYLFVKGLNRDYDCHYATASYVIQRRGRVRPFFQVGMGMESVKFATQPLLGHGAGWAALLGGGARFEMGKSLFVRVEGRAYYGKETSLFAMLVSFGRSF